VVKGVPEVVKVEGGPIVVGWSKRRHLQCRKDLGEGIIGNPSLF